MGNENQRFDGNFLKESIERKTPDHEECGRGFRCSRPEFQTFWKHRIPRDENALLGQCWVLTNNGKLAAYITLLADKIRFLDENGEETTALIDEGVKYTSFPAIKIGLLARDQRAPGAGTILVEWAIDYVIETVAAQVGVRFLTVDAAYDRDVDPVYDVSNYYAKLGFEYTNPREEVPPIGQEYRSMFMDLKRVMEAYEAENLIEN